MNKRSGGDFGAEGRETKKPKVDAELNNLAQDTSDRKLWVVLKSVDQAAEVTLPNNANVYELKKAVKAEFAATLQHVDAGELQVFLSCDAYKLGSIRALDPGKAVSSVGADASSNQPLYVHFEDGHGAALGQDIAATLVLKRIEEKVDLTCEKVDLTREKVDLTREKVDLTCALQMKMATVSAVTESAAATQTRGSDWRRKVGDYYNFCQCMVLSQLFPAERAPGWFQDRNAGDEFRRARGPFPAVAEHIIPKGQDSVGKAWDVNVHEECNGLLLLRHLERTYQAGKWSMLPVPDGPHKGMFEIYVSEEIQAETIMYYPAGGQPIHRVKAQGEPLQFQVLHGRHLDIIDKYQANPSLRSLFLKAEMAHRVDKMLPDPTTRLETYTIRCGKMNQPNWRMWQLSEPDNSVPVVQEVHED